MFEGGHHRVEHQPLPVDESIGGLELRDVVAVEARAAQSDAIQADDHRRRSVGEHEWRDVLHHLGAAAHHGESTDAAELVHGGVPSQASAVAHLDVSAQHDPIGQKHLVTYATIVGHVGADHQHAVVAH